MSEHENAGRIRALFAALRDRDIAAVRDAIDADAVWHFPGRAGKLAGDHAGHDGIFTFLARVEGLTDGTFSLELEEVLADDSHVVVFFRGHGERRGRVLDNPTCLKIRMRDGLVRELWEFVWDLYAVDEFWG